MDKRRFAQYHATKNDRILEFAPAYSPMYSKKEGYAVEIVDYLNREELIKRSIERNYGSSRDSWDKIEDVDYVCGRHFAEYIGKTGYYDIIAASHFIEHTVDIIEYLNDISILMKDDGIVKLMIPDKRYDFDLCRDISSTRVAIDEHVYRNGMTNHSIGTRMEGMFRSCMMQNNDVYIYNGALALSDKLEWECQSFISKEDELLRFLENHNDYGYDDCHSWIMTPCSFKIMIYELNVLRYIDLAIENMIAEKDGLSFFVELKKRKIQFDADSLKALYLERHLEMADTFRYIDDVKRIKNGVGVNRPIYIYGTGDISAYKEEFLSQLGVEWKGYIVSDGYRKCDTHNDKPVYELSEINKEDSSLVIIASSSYRQEIEKLLTDRGIEYV